jgi:hypothetical protein
LVYLLPLVGLPALSEAVALAVHLQDVNVVSKAVQQRSSQPLRSEHFSPLIEGQVGGHHCGATLVALAEHFEEQLCPGLGQWNEAQFVDDQQLEVGQSLLHVEEVSLRYSQIWCMSRESELGGAPADQSVLNVLFISGDGGSIRELDSSGHLA